MTLNCNHNHTIMKDHHEPHPQGSTSAITSTLNSAAPPFYPAVAFMEIPPPPNFPAPETGEAQTDERNSGRGETRIESDKRKDREGRESREDCELGEMNAISYQRMVLKHACVNVQEESVCESDEGREETDVLEDSGIKEMNAMSYQRMLLKRACLNEEEESASCDEEESSEEEQEEKEEESDDSYDQEELVDLYENLEGEEDDSDPDECDHMKELRLLRQREIDETRVIGLDLSGSGKKTANSSLSLSTTHISPVTAPLCPVQPIPTVPINSDSFPKLSFSVHYSRTSGFKTADIELAVVGSIPELGSWRFNKDKCLFLSNDPEGVGAGEYVSEPVTISSVKGQSLVEYYYVVFDRNSDTLRSMEIMMPTAGVLTKNACKRYMNIAIDRAARTGKVPGGRTHGGFIGDEKREGDESGGEGGTKVKGGGETGFRKRHGGKASERAKFRRFKVPSDAGFYRVCDSTYNQVRICSVNGVKRVAQSTVTMDKSRSKTTGPKVFSKNPYEAIEKGLNEFDFDSDSDYS
eukprot:GHVQ01029980.1.p2 GENE.GHVQ01029980.1~~GHVQ01029980.1.p2  ORF type:complete len:524 (-),score=106.75 GHVQ01029980.1:2467-4038(-)